MLYIDNINIAETYKVYVTNNGIKDFLKFPSLKQPIINEWHEFDGVEVDLSDPVLNSVSISINFAGLNNEKTLEFKQMLSDKNYHNFMFMNIYMSKNLRLISESNNNVLNGLSTFTLKFIEDIPMFKFSPAEPSVANRTRINIDGKNLSSYYVRTVGDISSQLMELAEIKQGLEIKSKHLMGSTYFPNLNPKFKTKDLDIKCLFNSNLRIELHSDRANEYHYWYQYYYNLLLHLIQPKERILEDTFLNKKYKCYYKSSSVEYYSIQENMITIKFTIKLCIINFNLDNE